MIGGIAALACSSASPTTAPKIDGGRDSSLVEGGTCTIQVPPGTICETTCYNISTTPISPYACQVYCSPPDAAGPGNCSCNGGFEPEGGLCPGDLECGLAQIADAGTQVLC
jgi:hypothetical protein